MAFPISLPERYKFVSATAGPVTTNGGATLAYVSLKNVHKAWLVLNFRQAVSHATVIQPTMATAVAGTGVTSIVHSARWWKNANVATNDTLVRGTAAASVTLTTGAVHQQVIIEIDPDDLNAAGYNTLGGTVSDSSQATNFVSGTYILATRYPQSNPPSAVVD